MASSIREVDQAIASINKGADKKEELRMALAPYSNWDSFLNPAPMTIAILGQLMLVSADSDFSLRDDANPITFTHLKYPGSFRACLVQVSNQGWKAFNLAHTNMDQIRLHSGNVDCHVRTAVKFLLKGSAAEVRLMLPKALDSISNIADDCLVLASAVEAQFLDVMNMVGELLEACTRAKGQYDEELKKTQIAIAVLNTNKESVEERKKEAERVKNETMDQMKNAERDYKEAMDKVPTGGELLGMAVADAFIGAVKTLSNIVPSTLGRKGESSSAGQSISSEGQAPTDDGPKKKTKLTEVFSVVSQVKVQAEMITKIAFGGKNDKKKPNWDAVDAMNGAERIKQTVQRLLVNVPRSPLGANVEEICREAIDICEKLLSLKKAFTKGDSDIEDVQARVKQLKKDVEETEAGLSAILDANTLANKSPHQARQQQQQTDDGSLVKSAMESARFKTEMAKQNLKENRERYDQSCREADERMKEMSKILAELAQQNPKELNLEAITATLVKGMKALGQLREEWGKLVQFFTMLSNLVKCCLTPSLHNFVETSNIQMQLGSQMSDTMRDVLFEQAFKANQIAYVVNSIAGAYTEISSKHLMHRITCLGKLIALDPQDDLDEIMLKKKELMDGCDEAQTAIKAIAKQKKKDIDEAIDRKIGRIESEVEAILPAMAPDEVKEMKGRVKTAMDIKKVAMEENLDDLV